MCGIAGLLHFDATRPVDGALLERMTDVQRHRGPDARGFWRSGPVGLGHRRLSIIDLAGGAQPMTNEDETVWIVFNGEIFNFQDLRQELVRAGHRFRTHSDTEVIVHLWEEEGPEGCAAKLLGQFAFAIWDSKRRSLYLARDQLGIKPLYYRASSDGLAFASELKGLLEDAGCPRDLDPDALLDYLSYRYVPGPGTIFRGISKLPPGHWLLVEGGRVRTERYWAPPIPTAESAMGEEEARRRLEELLTDAVRRQLMSDVPLGAFLSGGIDSSIVVGIMAKLGTQPVKTFTIGFREEAWSEVRFARKVAEMHHTEHRELIVEPDSIDLLPRILAQFDEPFADPSAIPTYYVCRMAREHVTVAISGDGGDEAFAGYRRYAWALRDARFDVLPGALRRGLSAFLGSILPRKRWRSAARRLGLDPAVRYAVLFGYQGGRARDGLLAEGLRRRAAEREDFALVRRLHEEARGTDYLSRLQYIDLSSYLPDDILVKTDRTSMLTSLEVRVPLLDHRIVEFAAGLSPSLRRGKRILKAAGAPLLPPEILHRGKMGFGVPLKHWFRGDWKAYARDLLLGRRAVERGFLEPRAVAQLLDDQADDRSKSATTLYALVALEEWCRAYLDGTPKPASGASPSRAGAP